MRIEKACLHYPRLMVISGINKNAPYKYRAPFNLTAIIFTSK
jgi:hypothetical protein